MGAYSSVQTDFGAVLKDKMDMTEKEQKQLSEAIESVSVLESSFENFEVKMLRLHGPQ